MPAKIPSSGVALTRRSAGPPAQPRWTAEDWPSSAQMWWPQLVPRHAHAVAKGPIQCRSRSAPEGVPGTGVPNTDSAEKTIATDRHVGHSAPGGRACVRMSWQSAPRSAVLRCVNEGVRRRSGASFCARPGAFDRRLRMVAPSRRQPSGPVIILGAPRSCRVDYLPVNVPAHGRAPSRMLGESVGARRVQVGLSVP